MNFFYRVCDKIWTLFFRWGIFLVLDKQEGSEMCPISTMKDMYDIVKESDKVVTF